MDLYSALDDKHLVLKTWITQFILQTTPCLRLAFVRVHQMAPPRTVVTTSSCSLLLIRRPRKDERLSRPSWLTYSERLTHGLRYARTKHVWSWTLNCTIPIPTCPATTAGETIKVPSVIEADNNDDNGLSMIILTDVRLRPGPGVNHRHVVLWLYR